MKRINKKKFYPCQRDYEELENHIVGASEETGTGINSPYILVYPSCPSPCYCPDLGYPPLVTWSFSESITGGILTE